MKRHPGSRGADGPGGRPARVLYVCYAAPVPPKLGPARRHYHILDQLSRFYEVDLVASGGPSEAELFARDLGRRVSRVEFVPARWAPGRGRALKILADAGRPL